jgi:hypothetical protein
MTNNLKSVRVEVTEREEEGNRQTLNETINAVTALRGAGVAQSVQCLTTDWTTEIDPR